MEVPGRHLRHDEVCVKMLAAPINPSDINKIEGIFHAVDSPPYHTIDTAVAIVFTIVSIEVCDEDPHGFRFSEAILDDVVCLNFNGI